jgi:peptide/nickel transport system ATP-binding protein/oligopeptide transport system ATP-binding protein
MSSGPAHSTPQPLLGVRDLHVYFDSSGPTSRAVEGVSFDVGLGETVCLVGESGCGKTVSALSVLGLLPQPPARIPRGEILFQGRNLLSLSEDQMRSVRGAEIGMVFQDPLTSLNPVFTVRDQIEEAITAHERAGPEELSRRCLQALRDVGIPSPRERLRNYPFELSGGQRQRVMIAMALVCNPRLIIADEPTTALDVTIQAQIIRLFNSIQEEGARSVLYITHDLGVVANVAHRVYVMYAGLIVEQGTVQQLFRETGHPYTQGLLASLPDVGKRGSRLPIIPGAVPNPASKPGGCPFHPRCYAALESCARRFPEMVDCGSGHLARCPVLHPVSA